MKIVIELPKPANEIDSLMIDNVLPSIVYSIAHDNAASGVECDDDNLNWKWSIEIEK